jgi:hypothetical protein
MFCKAHGSLFVSDISRIACTVCCVEFILTEGKRKYLEVSNAPSRWSDF